MASQGQSPLVWNIPGDLEKARWPVQLTSHEQERIVVQEYKMKFRGNCGLAPGGPSGLLKNLGQFSMIQKAFVYLDQGSGLKWLAFSNDRSDWLR